MNTGCYRYRILLLLTSALFLLSTVVCRADVTVDQLTGEDKEMFDKFRHLLQYGEPDEFFSFAKDYEHVLHDKGYMMLYYKLLNNEGFFALRHNMVFRAMQVGERLNEELHNDGASQYYYLATGLMGDIYNSVHIRNKAEQFFIQALEEVEETDPKFSMRTYQSLAEMLSMKDASKALQWMEKSMALAKETDNVEYLSLSLAMTAYIYFLEDNAKAFRDYYDQYVELRSQKKQGFSHRYDNILEIAQLSFDGQYGLALNKLQHGGTLYVDSSLVAIHIFTKQRDIDKVVEAVKRRHQEMDSIYSLAQSGNFDQLATERALIMTREESLANKKLAKKLTYWLIALTSVYIFVYLMGRRRLIRKIWASNRQLKIALEKAEGSDRMKSAFIRSMSHEIRTPLNAVSGFSQVLCNPNFELDDEEKHDMEVRISNNVNQITNIINEMLELSKSESETSIDEKEKQQVCCNDLGRKALEDVRGKQHSGVELRFTSEVDDAFTVHTNANRLKVALRHLLDNAAKFTDTGYVELSVAKQSDRMLFRVTDTGVGIKEEDRERIFETFSKVDDFKEGIGLGLPICRRLITSLGGEVQLDPTYSQGCRFIISLPME
jgi:signal transduction histidine kinase